MESKTKWLENKHRKFSSKTVFLNNMTGDDQQLKCYILHKINLKSFTSIGARCWQIFYINKLSKGDPLKLNLSKGD